jgi:hypothetical protein
MARAFFTLSGWLRKAMSRRVMKLTSPLIFLVLVIGLLEFTTTKLVDYGLMRVELPIAHAPESQFYDGDHPIFGVWHVPNAQLVHPRACFSALYESNAVGARDRDRERAADSPRVIFLGDSFAEGWGNEAEQRLSNRLEEATGIEHLNFGMSFFSPYQSLLVYRHLAKTFEHSAVMLAVLPENDFVDMDLDLAMESPDYTYRYRPYLRRTPDGYEHFDYVENRLVRWLRRHSYGFAALRAASAGVKKRLFGRKIAPVQTSRFYELEDEQFQRLEYILERLAEEAEGKKLVVLLLPTDRDFRTFRAGAPSPLAKRLEAFGARESVTVIDMLPLMAAKTRQRGRYFFSCDYHWSPFANRVAAGLLLGELAGVIYEEAAR